MPKLSLPTLITICVFLFGYALCAVQFPDMVSARVGANLFNDSAYLGVLAVGMTFVVISGGIDLSVGAVMAFTAVLLAVSVSQWGLHPLVAFSLALVLATGFGALVGAAIHYLEAPPFIATLTAMFLARGGAILMSGDSIAVRHELYVALSEAGLGLPGGGRLSFIALTMLALFAAGGVLLHKTRFGANVYAIGGDKRSAALMGVPIARTTMLIYALSGFTAGMAGIVFSLYTQAGYALSAMGVELDVIAAVVIGGALLTGGAGGVIGTLFGVLIQALIQTYLAFEGTLSSWWTKIAIGLLIFAFILLQRLAGPAQGRPRRGAKAS
jgi:galactofuranose transport system permease protein